ncbi:MAG TPA: thiamine pyrophosphate-binding protein, partial [Candidatus Methylomirabilis sp.]|nr:thiamine pyrophosphate-binding protein [Candidatus Methylomirabilis sp.]
GVPGGGSNLELVEAARIQGLPFVLCHQEWAACIMAAVTGELTGLPGVALSTLGPGVTASATGLAHAFLDRSPMLYVSDRHPDAALAFTTHQRVDHRALVAPIVKESVTVAADSVSRSVAAAARLASADPRGPVHLDLPADLGARPVGADGSSADLPSLRALDDSAVEAAAAMIREARRPLVVAGLQCRLSDAKWLRAFCEALPVPCLTTYKAKGALPDPHPLAMGVFTGGVLEEPVVKRADLIIAIGLDPVELIPRRWPYAAPVLNLVRSPSRAGGADDPDGGYFVPALEVVGDLGALLEEFAPQIAGRARSDWDVVEVDRLRRARRAALEVPVPGLAPHRVVQIARELTPAGTIASVDAGAHMFPATAYWDAVEPGELLISNGLATMGFALPAAIAAQLVHPERRVICFTGDGGLMMVAAELETAARLQVPIAVVVFDDGALSLIQIKQEQKGYEGTSMRYGGPDLVALARAFGIRALTASDEAAFRSALLSALTAPGPTLIDARIDPSGYRRTLEIVRGAPGS